MMSLRRQHPGRLGAQPGFTLVEFLAVLTMMVALVSVGWPRWWEAPRQARQRQTAWGLHQIQVALERYAADAGGKYPDFLYGGDFSDDFASSSAPRQSSWKGDVDPLLELGYLSTYPRNPFADSRGRKHRQFEPRDWQLMRDPGRVGWMSDGGDRALQLASRKVGGTFGVAMLDCTEGQRHAPPVWAVPIRLQDNRFIRIETPWRKLMAGNFVYHARYAGGGGYRWDPAQVGQAADIPVVRSKPMGYALWAYGTPSLPGLDIHTTYGLPLDPWIRTGSQGRPAGPDSNPDGVLMLLEAGGVGEFLF